jgi:hypothetical protein
MTRSGLSAQLGIATEETVGTYKAPSTFLPFESESLVLTKNYIESKGLRAGAQVQSQTLHAASSRTVAGDFSMEFLDTGMGKILNLLHGNTVTPSKSETKTYKQTHEIGKSGKDPYGKSLTIQVGRPDTANTVQPFSYLGCKVTGIAFSVDSGGTMMVNPTIVGLDEKTGEALGSATYATEYRPFTFEKMEVKIGGSKVAYVRSLTINVSVPQSTDRMNLGQSGIILEPILNDFVTVDVSATLEFASLTNHTRFTNEEVVELALLGTGKTIEAAKKTEANFTIKAAKQVNSGVAVGGPDILTQQVTFKGLDNGTNAPLVIETQSEDSAL